MSSHKVRIYGTKDCPYTQRARKAFGEKAIFVDVGSDQEKLEEMLRYSKGKRAIPVIVEGDEVTIGFGGT